MATSSISSSSRSSSSAAMTLGRGSDRLHHYHHPADSVATPVDEVLYGGLRDHYEDDGHHEHGLVQLPTQPTQQESVAESDSFGQESIDELPVIPRHERKRRLRAVEEARRYHLEEQANDDVQGESCRRNDRGGSDSRSGCLPSFSRRPPLSRGPTEQLSPLRPDGQGQNPFAQLEALFSMQQQPQLDQEPVAAEPLASSVRAAIATPRAMDPNAGSHSAGVSLDDAEGGSHDRPEEGWDENCQESKLQQPPSRSPREADASGGKDCDMTSRTRSAKRPVPGVRSGSSLGWRQDPPPPSSSSPLALLEHGRRHLASSAKKQGSSSQLRRQQQRSLVPSPVSALPETKRAKKRVVAPTSRSIVGSRPAHWSAKSAGPTAQRASSLASFTKAQKSRVIAELERRVVLKPSASLNLLSNQKNRLPPAEAMLATGRDQVTNRLPPGASSREGEDNLPSTADRPSSAPVSFAPPFLALAASEPCAARRRAEDVLIEDEDGIKESADELMGGFLSPSSTSLPHGSGGWTGDSSPAIAAQPFRPPPPHKRSKRDKSNARSGLLHRLKAIRDEVRADSIRLQSGNYGSSILSRSRSGVGYSSGYFGMNDPRSLAKSYMDVTILSDVPVARDSDHGKLVYLVYCHLHSETSGRIRQHSTSPCSRTGSAAESAIAGNAAWLCVTFATARERDLPATRDLRIYNPIVLALSPEPRVARTATAAGSSGSLSETLVKHLIVATQVCEVYSDHLPKLPNPSSILQELNVT